MSVKRAKNKGRITQNVGATGEDVACIFLTGRGFTILERNYRKPWGEIDIVAVKDDIVRFVEVKAISIRGFDDISRENEGYRPEEQIHPWKLNKIARTAELYMTGKKDEREYQIDAVGVFLDHAQRKARCRLFEQIL